jgi:hypothetical protein
MHSKKKIILIFTSCELLAFLNNFILFYFIFENMTDLSLTKGNYNCVSAHYKVVHPSSMPYSHPHATQTAPLYFEKTDVYCLFPHHVAQLKNVLKAFHPKKDTDDEEADFKDRKIEKDILISFE